MDTLEKNQSLKVFMLPWLAHGHVSPYLELAKRLTKRNLFIYLCSTPINLQSITGKFNDYSSSIQLVDLHLPSSPELPPDLHTTNGLPPHLMKTLGDAFQRSQPNLASILKELKPDIVIHETMHPWVGDLASSLNIPAIVFLSASATTISFFMHMMGRNPGVDFPFPGVYLHDFERSKLIAQAKSAGDDSKNRHHSIENPKPSCNIMLIKSFRELEGEAIDYFSAMSSKQVLPVGPLVEDAIKKSNNDSTIVIEWLNKKEKQSTVFVSFGSEYFLSKEEMEEVAYGLELSEVNFIWVVRFPKEGKESIRVKEDELPKGFLERVGEKGLVLEGWAPQVEILNHDSLGGFMSHCGWGSTMESMKYGVPIIALPMHLDQPLNARLMVHAGLAVEAVRDKNGKIQREEVAKAARQVVVDESGEDVRKKVKELSMTLLLKGDREIDVVVEEMIRISKESKENEVQDD